MKIEKNGFYKLSQFNKRKIEIGNNLIVAIFDDVFDEVNIKIGENSKLEFYGFYEGKNGFENKINNVSFVQSSINSCLIVKYLVLPNIYENNSKKVEFKIYSDIKASYCKSLINIISFVVNESKVDIDGIIKIGKGLNGVEGNLVEENIFLGDNGNVVGKPILHVASNDVKAGHSCKIERISDDKLFYLKSRGLSSHQAISLMLEAKVKNLYSCLSMIDNVFYENLVEKILLEIN